MATRFHGPDTEFFPLRARTLVQKHSAPFADDPLGVLLVRENESRPQRLDASADGRQATKTFFGSELLHLLSVLRDGICFCTLPSGPENLHSGSPVQLINIRLKHSSWRPIKSSGMCAEKMCPGRSSPQERSKFCWEKFQSTNQRCARRMR